MTNINRVLVVIAVLLFSSTSTAQLGNPQYPAEASFHFVGITEFVVIETVSVYSELTDTFVPGLSTQVEQGTVASELWVDTELFDAEPSAPGESTATGKITSVRGTRAGDQVGEPLTASLLLAPFGIGVTDNGSIRTFGVTESEITTVISDDNLDEWRLGMGELSAEGLRLETDVQNQAWLTSGLNYQFEIEAQPNGNGANTFVAQEVFTTTEIQGNVPAVEGTILLERRVVSTFNGAPSRNGRLSSFHFLGTTEFVVIETVSVYSENSGTFLSGPSTQVEQGTVTSELWVDTELFDAEPSASGESTATGKITSVRGTQAGDQVGEPLTASLLLTPFGIGVTDNGPIQTIGVTESEITTVISDDNSDEWRLGMGELSAEGLRLETDVQNQTWLTSGLNYQFEIEAQPNGNGANTFVAQEVFTTTEIQGNVPVVEGTILLERRVVSTFNGALTGYQGTISAVPTISVYGLIIAGCGLILIASRRLRRIRRQGIDNLTGPN